jgi:hypothetical protein
MQAGPEGKRREREVERVEAFLERSVGTSSLASGMYADRVLT